MGGGLERGMSGQRVCGEGIGVGWGWDGEEEGEHNPNPRKHTYKQNVPCGATAAVIALPHCLSCQHTCSRAPSLPWLALKCPVEPLGVGQWQQNTRCGARVSNRVISCSRLGVLLPLQQVTQGVK